MTKEEFKAKLVIDLIGDILVHKDVVVDGNKTTQLDLDNVKSCLGLIQKLADFAFNGE